MLADLLLHQNERVVLTSRHGVICSADLPVLEVVADADGLGVDEAHGAGQPLYLARLDRRAAAVRRASCSSERTFTNTTSPLAMLMPYHSFFSRLLFTCLHLLPCQGEVFQMGREALCVRISITDRNRNKT